MAGKGFGKRRAGSHHGYNEVPSPPARSLLPQELHLWKLGHLAVEGVQGGGPRRRRPQDKGVSVAGAPPLPTSRHLMGNSFRPLFLGESKTTGSVLCGAWM